MLRGLFVTGTDTGVGKTVLAAAVIHRYRRKVPLRYWKPIQTGIEQDDDTAAVRVLGDCRDEEIFDEGVRLPRPLSPHLAARLEGQTIKLDPLVKTIAGAPQDANWIVEGAGGVLVPLNQTERMADLVRRLALPVLIAARSTLGTINHTLLTLEALRNRSLTVAGVVLIGPPNRENRAAIEQFGEAAVLGEMPCFDSLSPESLREWARAELDPEGRLLKFFHV